MRTAILALGLVAISLALADPLCGQSILDLPDASSSYTHFTVHNIRPAHAITKGAGARVGILDHSFGVDIHPELYSGGVNFQIGEWGESFKTQSHHGYWMALALHEVAPEAEIYALNTYSSDESDRVRAMVKAINWAIDHDLDVLTYSAETVSPEGRAILDPAVDRAIQAGVVIVFCHYPHPQNLFTGGIAPRAEAGERDPDLNIFQYDCTVVFGDQQVAFMSGDGNGPRSNRPFHSTSSTAPVAAGFVALLRSVDPALSPGRIKEILMTSSHPLDFAEGRALRVPDIAEAVGRARAQLTEEPRD